MHLWEAWRSSPHPRTMLKGKSSICCYLKRLEVGLLVGGSSFCSCCLWVGKQQDSILKTRGEMILSAGHKLLLGFQYRLPVPLLRPLQSSPILLLCVSTRKVYWPGITYCTVKCEAERVTVCWCVDHVPTGRLGRQGSSSHRTGSTYGHPGQGQTWRNQGPGKRLPRQPSPTHRCCFPLCCVCAKPVSCAVYLQLEDVSACWRTSSSV